MDSPEMSGPQRFVQPNQFPFQPGFPSSLRPIGRDFKHVWILNQYAPMKNPISIVSTNYKLPEMRNPIE
jgi:hypothetical protein